MEERKCFWGRLDGGLGRDCSQQKSWTRSNSNRNEEEGRSHWSKAKKQRQEEEWVQHGVQRGHWTASCSD